MAHNLPARFEKLNRELDGKLQENFEATIALAHKKSTEYCEERYVVYDDDYFRFLAVSPDFLEWREAVYYVAYPD